MTENNAELKSNDVDQIIDQTNNLSIVQSQFDDQTIEKLLDDRLTNDERISIVQSIGDKAIKREYDSATKLRSIEPLSFILKHSINQLTNQSSDRDHVSNNQSINEPSDKTTIVSESQSASQSNDQSIIQTSNQILQSKVFRAIGNLAIDDPLIGRSIDHSYGLIDAMVLTLQTQVEALSPSINQSSSQLTNQSTNVPYLPNSELSKYMVGAFANLICNCQPINQSVIHNQVDQSILFILRRAIVRIQTTRRAWADLNDPNAPSTNQTNDEPINQTINQTNKQSDSQPMINDWLIITLSIQFFINLLAGAPHHTKPLAELLPLVCSIGRLIIVDGDVEDVDDRGLIDRLISLIQLVPLRHTLLLAQSGCLGLVVDAAKRPNTSYQRASLECLMYRAPQLPRQIYPFLASRLHSSMLSLQRAATDVWTQMTDPDNDVHTGSLEFVFEYVDKLVTLTLHSDQTVATNSSQIISNLAWHCEARVTIGKPNNLAVFVKHLTATAISNDVNQIQMCCLEAVSRLALSPNIHQLMVEVGLVKVLVNCARHSDHEVSRNALKILFRLLNVNNEMSGERGETLGCDIVPIEEIEQLTSRTPSDSVDQQKVREAIINDIRSDRDNTISSR